MVRKFVSLLMVCALALSLAAGWALAAPKEVKLTMSYAGGDPLTKQLIHDIVTAFMKANPHIKIEEFPSGSGAYTDFLKVKDSVGEFPDVVEMRDTALFVRAGKLAPLPRDIVSLFAATIPVYGADYTAPMVGLNTSGIMYNKKFFKQNGFTEPKTYGEFLQLCEKIKAKGVAPLVIGMKDIWHIGFWFSKYWLDEIGIKNPNWIADRYAGKVKFSDPDFARAMNGLIDLFKKGYVEPGYMSTSESQCPAILISGKAAMYYFGTNVFKQLEEADPNFEYGWFFIPDAKGKFNIMGGPTSQGWALSAECAKDPAKYKAGAQFIKFFFAKKQYTYFLENMNAFPTTKAKISWNMTPNMKKVFQYYTGPKYPKGLNWNNGAGMNELPPAFRNYTYKLIQEMSLNMYSVEEGLKKMDAEWANEVKDFNPAKK